MTIAPAVRDAMLAAVPSLRAFAISLSGNVDQKKALFARIVELLAQHPGLRPQDVLINLVEVAKENWSFGNGIAQYAA